MLECGNDLRDKGIYTLESAHCSRLFRVAVVAVNEST